MLIHGGLSPVNVGATVAWIQSGVGALLRPVWPRSCVGPEGHRQSTARIGLGAVSVDRVIDPEGRVRQTIPRHHVDVLQAAYGFRDDVTFYTAHGDVFA